MAVPATMDQPLATIVAIIAWVLVGVVGAVLAWLVTRWAVDLVTRGRSQRNRE
ncbi:MAG TPA: hypothetical protein VHL09_16170 [Dehalococcoidia bacterium]|nr:hypothetical protein [Dehalococcoidia bacterium]